ncbi:MAG TPA: T9SS type A sorting domain-containing protein [Bacteroidales bacterium]|nr:T9SS type A sorting domain-containing protein [Bacteroidales bacterium]
MKSKILFTTLFVLIATNTFSQNIFQKVTGIGYPGNAYSFCISSDSSFVTASAGSLVKTDTAGNILWAKKYLAPGMYNKSKVISLSNGGYIMLVSMSSDGFGSGDILFFNMDSEGLIKWIKYFGTAYTDIPEDVVELPNGDFVITGQTNSFGYPDKEVLLMRISKYGDQYWQRSYGTSSDYDIAHKLLYSAFGGFILSGEMSSKKNITRTDDHGTVKWCSSYGWGSLFDLSENPLNGDIYACGVITDDLRGGTNIFVMRADSSGNVIWSKKMGDNNNEIAYSICCDPAFSRLYVAGGCQVDSISAADAFVACLSAADGSIQWAKRYGSQQNDIFYDNAVYNDNSLVNVGNSECCDTAYQNIFMVKTMLDGTSGCNEYDFLPVIDSNLAIIPEEALINTDTGDLWVTSICFPPHLISHQQLTLCSTESIAEVHNSALEIYPNPAANHFNIVYELKGGETIDIFNETGEKVDFIYTSHGQTITVDSDKLPGGIYLLRISDNKTQFIRKFILD